jgi:hypothetical protein
MGELDGAGEDTAGENLFDGEGAFERVAIEAGEEKEAADLFADGVEELHFIAGIGVGQAVLDVEHADDAVAGDDGSGEEGLIGIGLKLDEGFEAGIVVGFARERDQAAVAGNPAGEPFLKGEADTADGGGRGGVGGAEDEFGAIGEIDYAGVTFEVLDEEGDNALENLLERGLANHQAADALEEMKLFFQTGQAQFKITEFWHRPYYHRDWEG